MFGSICSLNHDGPGGCTANAPGPEIGAIYHQYNMSRIVCKNYLVTGRCNHEGGHHICRLYHLSREDFTKDGGMAAINAALSAGEGRIPRAAPSAGSRSDVIVSLRSTGRREAGRAHVGRRQCPSPPPSRPPPR